MSLSRVSLPGFDDRPHISFIGFDLGYGAALSMALMLMLVIAGIQLHLLRDTTEF